MNIDNMIAGAKLDNWDVFADLARGPDARAPSLSPELAAKTEQLKYDAASVYATDQGQRLIDHLVAITLERPTYTAMLGLPMDAAYGHGVFREGQNAIVHLLLKMIAEGRKEQPPPERTST